MGLGVLTLRQRAERKDNWLAERLDGVVPRIMREADVDCWVLIAREYNEDPVVKTMLPATWEGARRRTILVFTDYGRTRVAISRYAVGSFFPAGWNPDEEPDQWRRLAEYLEDQAPQRIAINRSPTFALADGMTSTETALFLAALSSSIRSRVESSDALAVGWLETRAPSEIAAFPDVCARAHTILRRGLSKEVIKANETTTSDVEWWLREESRTLGYGTWFHPSVSVQRAIGGKTAGDPVTSGDEIVRHGDLIHIDFGIEYLTLHTDQQQHAYVLHPDETTAPAGLQQAVAVGNRLQDIVMSCFHTGVTGNEILRASREQAAGEGIRPAIYSHPIGLHGHGAGPTIGLWDQQDGVPGAGDYPVRANTAYSIELSVEVDIPEWQNQPVRIMLEEDAFFDGDGIEFLDGRQTDLWTI
jgi:Xaa-Pro aminopeptidase